MFQNRLGIDGDRGSIDFIVGMYEDGVIPTSRGHRTADELEREAYINGNVREAALWGFLHELETALDVAARLDE
jgi:hypothetical protein